MKGSRQIRVLDKRMMDILCDARQTAYTDGRFGHPQYRIGNMEFEQALAAVIDELSTGK